MKSSATPVCQAAFWFRCQWLLVAMCLLLGLFTQAAHAKRVALVVGNSSYAERPLRNPVNDANLMQATLKELGFEVTLLRNADRRSLLNGLRDFEGKARDAEVALFFFAGHGAQVGGSNYLIPVGGSIQSETDVPDEAVDAASVLRRLEEARSKVALVILDACRDNPFAGASRSASRGLGRMSVPTGTIVAYATAPGSTAADGTGSNGVYTEQLVRQFKTPNLDIKEVFDRTAQEVERITAGKQRPREEIGLRGRFVLNGNNAVQVASIRAEPVATTPQPGQATGLSLDDLEKEEASRKQWAQWQARMKADFDKTAKFVGSADLQARAWTRFLATWAQDNPLSREDEGLREQATARQQQAQGQITSAQAAPAQSAVAAFTPGQTIKDCADCPEMVLIRSGSFDMGSNNGDSDEKPVHRVSIRSFLMGKTEVTQGQWKAVMGSNPSHFSNCGDDCPVEKVSWNDAQEYVRKLSQQSGKNYRLPSEAEWEYACRAGGNHTYCGSDSVDAVGWYNSNSVSKTHSVAGKQANAFGLYDMSGNVWEWVQDDYQDNYNGAPSDGSAWSTGGSQRVLRGDSWYFNPNIRRSADRVRNAPDDRNFVSGFRIARTL
ncbi:MAG: SUMF1/EgtB/PvdO family nonheme iron enzyme [Comamonadaceae bacterium]|nr:SUMF1/EgtB/PvdO family nonheme iron enzyme [Comamonadaceae bacterium]